MKALYFLSYSNIFIALCAASLCSFCHLITYNNFPSWVLVGFVFSSTLFAYNFHRRIGLIYQKNSALKLKKTISFEDTDCPKCKSSKLMKGKSATGCSNFKACGFKVPFILMGKKLTENQLMDLVTKKKTSWIKGITNPADQQKIEGKFLMDDQFNVQFEQKT